MIFKQFEDKDLSQFSYLVADESTKEAIVVDPARNFSVYLEFAEQNGLTIKYVTETHIHADFASGIRNLALHSNASILLSSYDSKEKYEYKFPHQEIKDGDKLTVGSVSLKALHTPGHTPEHISFVLSENGTETALLSGDFLFIGSLGRPDLLGEDAKLDLAKQLFQSVQLKLKDLSDDLLIFPGHGAGSLCGSGMQKSASSNLGEERKFNPYLQESLTEEEFVSMILGNSPDMPSYYLKMKELNSNALAKLPELDSIPKVSLQDLMKETVDEAQIVDFRHPVAFGGAHIPGSINLPTTGKLGFWAAYVVDYDFPAYILKDENVSESEIIRAFQSVGLDNIKGMLEGGINSFVEEGEDFDDVPQVSVLFVDDMIEFQEQFTLIDVRTPSEFKEGHVKGARHFYLGTLENQLNKITKNKEDEPIYVMCGGGFRSSIACSILKSHGFENVNNIMGGFTAWKKQKLSIEVPKMKLVN